jgi:hypothetical protein
MKNVSKKNKSAKSTIGRPRVDDPRRSNHVTLSRLEREVCDGTAHRAGLGFSTWGRVLMLGAVSREQLDGKVPPASIGMVCQVMARALLRELSELPEDRRLVLQTQLVTAFSNMDEVALREVNKLGANA